VLDSLPWCMRVQLGNGRRVRANGDMGGSGGRSLAPSKRLRMEAQRVLEEKVQDLADTKGIKIQFCNLKASPRAAPSPPHPSRLLGHLCPERRGHNRQRPEACGDAPLYALCWFCRCPGAHASACACPCAVVVFQECEEQHLNMEEPPCGYLRVQLGWPGGVPFVHPHDLPDRAKQSFLEAYEPGSSERQQQEPLGIEVGTTPSGRGVGASAFLTLVSGRLHAGAL